MSDEGRRVFPMETALGVVAGKGGEDVLDFMGYAIGRVVDEDCRPAVNPMVRGWLFSLNPEFMKTGYDPTLGYDGWVVEQKKKLGDNVSLPPMSEPDTAGINALFETVEDAKLTAEDKIAEAEEALAARQAAEAEIKTLTPFKKKAEDLEAKVAKLEAQNSELSAQLDELKEKLASFDGKVAIDEKEIEKSVKDIVSRAVGALAAAGGVVAGAGEVAGACDFADSGSSSDSGSVPDSFGFGASGASDDGFGF